MKYLIEFLHRWQELFGAIIGASAPFILWWFAERYKKRKSQKESLYYLERLLVDQINMVQEVKRAIQDFINNGLNQLRVNIRGNPQTAYSIDHAFFPSFSVRPINENIHSINTGSGYLDNKIGKSYMISKDFPFMVDDIRQQFFHTIQLNKDISFNRLNPPEVQKKGYLDNIDAFQGMVQRDMIGKDIPIYLKTLVQTRVALNKFRKIGSIRWYIKFDVRFRFFWTPQAYEETKINNYENMEKYFEKEVDEDLEKISQM